MKAKATVARMAEATSVSMSEKPLFVSSLEPGEILVICLSIQNFSEKIKGCGVTSEALATPIELTKDGSITLQLDLTPETLLGRFEKLRVG
jgi:hypothetical protein